MEKKIIRKKPQKTKKNNGKNNMGLMPMSQKASLWLCVLKMSL